MPVVSSHDLTFGSHTVTKTYRSWARGEPQREWSALGLLQRHTPGLAPQPLSADLHGEPPSVVMTRLPGESLANAPVTTDQTEAMAAALHRLHTAVPATDLTNQPLRISNPAEAVASLRAWRQEPHELGDDPQTVAAFDSASRWLESAEPDQLVAADVPPVFAMGDGNLSNFIWCDGEVRLVDFEDSGRSDRAFELADIVEHISMWVDEPVNTHLLMDALVLEAKERTRFVGCRKLWSTFWLLMLLPSGRAHARNPVGTIDRQVQRVLRLL